MKIVLITGASSGIGYALAREYIRRGDSVALCARRVERLDELKREFTAGGRVLSDSAKTQEILPIKCDVTSVLDLREAVRLTLESFGRIDVVVANAGFGVVGDVDTLSIEDFQRQMDTNFYGVVRTYQETIESLRQSKGVFCIVGSVNGYVALPSNSPYAVSKYAVRALAQSLYFEAKPYGVGVTHIAPGFVASEIRKVDNLGQFKHNAKDRIPTWLQMSAERAAMQIANAIKRRRFEKILTAHGCLIVCLARFCPGLLRFLILKLSVKGRSAPSQT
ncbi:MAG: SDR family NAD(P)-dependent oxidoreductase [Proteobacteria bacterium]|nr:SDR family NAD(P)-dependent oxidoreductase [Pseudomonadota bacterium]